MFVVNNFLMSIAQLLDFLLTAYMWIIIGRAVISWVNADPYNPDRPLSVRGHRAGLAASVSFCR